MKITYVVEVAAKGSVEEDIEKTLESIKKFGVQEYYVGDEKCEDDVCSGFIEVVLDGDWGRHVEFAKRFAPTVIEPTEKLYINGKDFFLPIVNMAFQSRALLRGSGIKIPYSNFSGPKKLPEWDIEQMILEERRYRINMVISALVSNPTVLLGTFERAGIVNDYLVRDKYLGVDFIGDIGNIVMLVLYFMPVAIEPVEPVEYDLTPVEIGDVLMIIADRSREVIETFMKKKK